jgi:hypothetical protein
MINRNIDVMTLTYEFITVKFLDLFQNDYRILNQPFKRSGTEVKKVKTLAKEVTINTK